MGGPVSWDPEPRWHGTGKSLGRGHPQDSHSSATTRADTLPMNAKAGISKLFLQRLREETVLNLRATPSLSQRAGSASQCGSSLGQPADVGVWPCSNVTFFVEPGTGPQVARGLPWPIPL